MSKQTNLCVAQLITHLQDLNMVQRKNMMAERLVMDFRRVKSATAGAKNLHIFLELSSERLSDAVIKIMSQVSGREQEAAKEKRCRSSQVVDPHACHSPETWPDKHEARKGKLSQVHTPKLRNWKTHGSTQWHENTAG